MIGRLLALRDELDEATADRARARRFHASFGGRRGQIRRAERRVARIERKIAKLTRAPSDEGGE